tara:strand:+ start:251 stop:529 length:279 start_codon:yes stop_codon:yes gene_type:complete
MNTKFSKSPWMVTPQGPADANGMGICSMWGEGEELMANVDLIAAAPDMYAMIKEVADMQKQWYGYGMDTHIKLAKMAKKMELILAKARGDQS